MNRTSYGYMKTKYNYTPSDYDINLKYKDIPTNINYIDANNLTRQLQQKTPLTRKIHLQLTETTLNTTHTIQVRTGLRVKTSKENKEVDFK